MRFPFNAAAIVALSLIACNGPRESTPEIRPAFILKNLGKYRRQYVGIVVDGEKRMQEQQTWLTGQKSLYAPSEGNIGKLNFKWKRRHKPTVAWLS